MLSSDLSDVFSFIGLKRPKKHLEITGVSNVLLVADNAALPALKGYVIILTKVLLLIKLYPENHSASPLGKPSYSKSNILPNSLSPTSWLKYSSSLGKWP